MRTRLVLLALLSVAAICSAQTQQQTAVTGGVERQAGTFLKAHNNRAVKHRLAAMEKFKEWKAATEAEEEATAQGAAGAEMKVTGLEGQALEVALEGAEKAEAQRVEAHPEVDAQIIRELPAAQLVSGDDDISTTGECRSEIDGYCQGINPGEGRLADCLSHHLLAAAQQPAGFPFTDQCKAAIDQYRQQRASSLNANIPLAKACKKDIKKYCADYGTIELSCLRGEPERLSQRCYNEVFKVELVAADDIRSDPGLYAACEADVKTHCAKVEPHHGRVQRCLRKRKSKLHWDCRAQLFKDSVYNADDIRLSTVTFETCLDDKRKFCPSVAPGHSKALECLEGVRNEADFSPECRDLLDQGIEQRSRDFELDPAMRRACKDDIRRTCGVELENLEKGRKAKKQVEDDGSVITCLQDYRFELKDEECISAVHSSLAMAASDIRFSPKLADACFEDRHNFCSSVPPGSARVLGCLQEKREQLSSDCKAALFDQEVTTGESIDFQYPLKAACQAELDQFCVGVPHDHARGIRCLEDNSGQPTFSEQCRQEVAQHQHHLAEDYRLNSRLTDACESAVAELCSAVACTEEAPCGGVMLRCLTDKVDQIQEPACKNEVEYFQKMEVRDYHNDLILAEVCRHDVLKHCKKVGSEEVHECLQEHMEYLLPKCAAEEVRLMTAAAGNYDLQPSLARDCEQERLEFCKDVKPGMSRIYNCLTAMATQVDFRDVCRLNLAAQQMRRLKDWRLDYNLKQACSADAPTHCADALKETTEGKTQGQVLKCLLISAGLTSESCTMESVRAVHVGLQFYQPDLPVIRACDNDVERYCIPRQLKQEWEEAKKPGKGPLAALGPHGSEVPIGQIRSCLTEHVESLPDIPEHVFEDTVLGEGEGSTPEIEASPNQTEGSPPRRRMRRRRMQQSGVDVTAALEDLPTYSEAEAEKIEEEEAEEDLRLSQKEHDDNLWKREPLSEECMSLVMLGEPEGYDSFQQLLSFGRLSSSLRSVQDALHLPEDSLVTLRVSDNGLDVSQQLTLTGWTGLAGAAAILLVVLGAIAYTWKQFFDTKYGTYELVSKRQRANELEMR